MNAVIWIIAGAVVLAACLSGKGNRKTGGSEGKPTRIDRPHYYDPDDCECSVCGARFQRRSAVCPNCGARFEGTREDEDEFIEEMEIWDDEDDS